MRGLDDADAPIAQPPQRDVPRAAGAVTQRVAPFGAQAVLRQNHEAVVPAVVPHDGDRLQADRFDDQGDHLGGKLLPGKLAAEQLDKAVAEAWQSRRGGSRGAARSARCAGAPLAISVCPGALARDGQSERRGEPRRGQRAAQLSDALFNTLLQPIPSSAPALRCES